MTDKELQNEFNALHKHTTNCHERTSGYLFRLTLAVFFLTVSVYGLLAILGIGLLQTRSDLRNLNDRLEVLQEKR